MSSHAVTRAPRRLLLGWVALSLAAPAFPAFGGEAPIPARPIPEDAFYTFMTSFGVQFGTVRFGAGAPGTARLQRVELFITRDMGRTWARYGEDPEGRSPMAVTVEGEGVYGFYSVGTDERGRREAEPRPGFRPETVVVVDRTPPNAAWISPTGPTLTNVDTVTFEWESEDDHYGENPVSIEVSGDYGRTWSVLGDELGPEKRAADLPRKGKYAWAPNARLGSPLRFRLVCRDLAGNTLKLRCDTEVLIDSIPPVVRVLRPSGATSLTVPIEYDASDEGGSGLMEVVLYATYDNGGSWVKSAADRRVNEPIVFTARQPGRIGLMAVARDGQGNHSPLPYEGMSPTFTLFIDVNKPVVRLSESFIGSDGTVPSGASRTVTWTAEDDIELELNSAIVEISEDDGATWTAAAANMASSPGLYTYLFPNVTSRLDGMRVRVSVRDRAGNVGSATSRPFAVQASQTAIIDLTTNTTSRAVTPMPVLPDNTGYTPSDNVTLMSLTRTDPAIGEPPIAPPTSYTSDATLPSLTTMPPPPDMSSSFTPSVVPGIPDASAAGGIPASRLNDLENMATRPETAAEALSQVNALIDTAPPARDLVDLYVIQGQAYLSQPHLNGYVFNATKAAHSAFEIDRNNPKVLYLLAESFLVSGRNYYDDIELDRNWNIDRVQYGQWAKKRDEHMAMARYFQAQLVETYPDNKYYLGMLGDILTYQGRAAQQASLREYLFTLDPDARAQVRAFLLGQPDAREPAGYMAAERAAHAAARPVYEQAAAVLKRALELPPANDYNNALMLGELYYRIDGLYNPREAIQYLIAATNSTDVPRNTYREAYYGLGMCMMAINPPDPNQAKMYFETALKYYDPDDDTYRLIQGELAGLRERGF